MIGLARIVLVAALVAMSSPAAKAGPAEDAHDLVERWSAAYSGNDPEAIAKFYTSDAILLGTVSPVMSEGTDAIIKYFTPTKGSGNINKIGEHRTIVIDDNAVIVTGFYEFTRMK